MNTNDFSKCKVGDKLWDHVHGCECIVERNDEADREMLLVESNGNGYWFKKIQNPIKQKLFFSKPEIIAPPEPIRLPDYKKGEWIAVWDGGDSRPVLLRFYGFFGERVQAQHGTSWSNHCSLSELPEVLAKWGEK